MARARQWNLYHCSVTADILTETAAAMVKPGKGLLACDESTGTVGSRLESIGARESARQCAPAVLAFM